MTGHQRLGWVTALTVASLLLGGGTLNALAEGHGGDKSRGNGSGNVEHGQQAAERPAEVRHANQSANRGREDDDKVDDDLVTPPAVVTEDPRPGMGCGDRNHEHLGAPGNPDKECKDRHDHDDDDDGEHEVED
jgi:hypothetical protein